MGSSVKSTGGIRGSGASDEASIIQVISCSRIGNVGVVGGNGGFVPSFTIGFGSVVSGGAIGIPVGGIGGITSPDYS